MCSAHFRGSLSWSAVRRQSASLNWSRASTGKSCKHAVPNWSSSRYGHVAELGEFDMRAGPLLEEVRDAHDFAHELVDAVVTLAQVDEIGFCEAFARAPER